MCIQRIVSHDKLFLTIVYHRAAIMVVFLNRHTAIYPNGHSSIFMLLIHNCFKSKYKRYDWILDKRTTNKCVFVCKDFTFKLSDGFSGMSPCMTKLFSFIRGPFYLLRSLFRGAFRVLCDTTLYTNKTIHNCQQSFDLISAKFWATAKYE